MPFGVPETIVEIMEDCTPTIVIDNSTNSYWNWKILEPVGGHMIGGRKSFWTVPLTITLYTFNY